MFPTTSCADQNQLNTIINSIRLDYASERKWNISKSIATRKTIHFPLCCRAFRGTNGVFCPMLVSDGIGFDLKKKKSFTGTMTTTANDRTSVYGVIRVFSLITFRLSHLPSAWLWNNGRSIIIVEIRSEDTAGPYTYTQWGERAGNR